MTPDISVIICTHNPHRDYFSRALVALHGQTLAMEKWELLVVDNCSTTAVAKRFDTSWQPSARIVREDTLGLTPARLRGIHEARGELLVFVDDDNVLDRDYLEQALSIAEQRPFLGSWSGQCRGGFEEEPPEWTRRYWGNLVIREFNHDVWSNLPRLADTMPCGAGLCVRREAAQHYLHLHKTGKRSTQLDRAGASLLSGGDNDLAACACDIGLGVGLISALKLTHLVPPERLTTDYLARLAYGITYSGVLLDAARGIPPQRRSRLSRIANWFRILKLNEPHRSILRAVQSGRANGVRAVAFRPDAVS